jgi:tetratricopeptide (TPR) repeat protein
LLRERDNFRAALDWTLAAGEVETALRLGGRLWPIWAALGATDEGRERLAAALALPGSDAAGLAARARALHGAGTLAEIQGDQARARAHYAESLALRRALGEPRGIARAGLSLAYATLEQGNHQPAEVGFAESLALYRSLGDRRGAAYALGGLGYLELDAGNHDAARARHEAALALYREIGDRRGIAHALAGLGYVALARADYTGARALHEASLAESRALGDRGSVVHRLSALGAIALLEGDRPRAAGLLAEGIALARELGGTDLLGAMLRDLALVALEGADRAEAAGLLLESLRLAEGKGGSEIAVTLECAARLAGTAGRPAVAARLYGAATALRAAAGVPQPAAEQHRWAGYITAARAQLGDVSWIAAWDAGRALSGAQALAEAASLLAAIRATGP